MITRRELAAVAAGSALAASAEGQTAPLPADLATSVRNQNKLMGDALAKFEIPLATEPAFQFKA